MNTFKVSSICLVILAVMVTANVAVAQKSKFQLPFRKSKPVAENQQGIELNQNCGPWLIMCASFVGEEGERQAENLVHELRSDYNLDAYVYRHRFDFPKEIKGIGWQLVDVGGEKDIVQARMKPAGESHFEEVAVLIGNFPDIEDSRAQRVLQQIKMLQPESLANFDPNRGSSQRLRLYREFVGRVSSGSESRAKGPLRAAFLLLNPMLPEEYLAANQVDHFVINLNKHVKHSLLDNPGIYSVRVATFRGEHSTFNLNEIQEKQEEESLLRRMGRPIRKSKLAEAAQKAHLLTDELRRNGVEAYEFHDRHESYVCIGSYNWISRTDANGVRVNNPEMVKVITTLKADKSNFANGAFAPQFLPRFEKTDIVFDAQPLPVVVPKAKANKEASSSPFASWQK